MTRNVLIDHINPWYCGYMQAWHLKGPMFKSTLSTLFKHFNGKWLDILENAISNVLKQKPHYLLSLRWFFMEAGLCSLKTFTRLICTLEKWFEGYPAGPCKIYPDFIECTLISWVPPCPDFSRVLTWCMKPSFLSCHPKNNQTAP